ncbi:hypothetical protein B0A48_14860 [Cryoendolithus antarcticus]|uniref:Transcription initiation factor TFIID subunit 13 n=1 Tax=Cryoendolithus antarcticus TaxID=1507870 RepID=A0A1V8SIT0_9PEZI|nr:hypothetical protein B0A48_14860 [Cryoendolithus antarcticus]
MTEPRARIRTKGQFFATDDPMAQPDLHKSVQSLLTSAQSPTPHLASALACLDDILTTFVIETCHYAALSASYSRRQKIKAEDCKFALRHDKVLLGRVGENAWKEKKVKDDKKSAGFDSIMEEAHGLRELAKGDVEGQGREADGRGVKKRRRGRKRGGKGGSTVEGR